LDFTAVRALKPAIIFLEPFVIQIAVEQMNGVELVATEVEVELEVGVEVEVEVEVLGNAVELVVDQIAFYTMLCNPVLWLCI
jgi:hypothetical protein